MTLLGSSSVSYTEIEGSPTFKASRDGMTAQQIIRIAWSDIANAINVLFPPPTQWKNGWLVPLPYTFPGREWLWLKDVDIAPFDPSCPGPEDTNRVATYSGGARVTMNFETTSILQSISEDTALSYIGTHKVSIGGQMFGKPNHGFYWKGDRNKKQLQDPEIRVPMLLPTTEHTITMEYVLKPPWNTIIEYQGHTNSESAPAIFHNTDNDSKKEWPGTILFLGAEAHRKVSPQGVKMWSLEYKFSERAETQPYLYGAEGSADDRYVGWNYYYRASQAAVPASSGNPGSAEVPGGWVKILSIVGDAQHPDGNTVYPEDADFSKLFVPDGSSFPF